MKKLNRLFLVGFILIALTFSGCTSAKFKNEVPTEIKMMVEQSMPRYLEQFVQLPKEELDKLISTENPSAIKMVESFNENAKDLGKVVAVEDFEQVLEGEKIYGKTKVQYEKGVGFVSFILSKQGEIESLSFEKNEPNLPMGLNTEGKFFIFAVVFIFILLAVIFFLRKKLSEFSDKLDFLRKEQLNTTQSKNLPKIHSISTSDGEVVDLEDGELISVFMAAIMAYESEHANNRDHAQIVSGEDGFVARKIRRRNKK